MQRKTKIIATIGPSSESENQIANLIKAGVNCFRINLSHGKEEKYTQQIKLIQKMRKKLDKNVAIMVDTRGPEIRVKKFADGKALLKKSQTFVFTSETVEGDSTRVSITEPIAITNAKIGKIVLADDGRIKFKITDKTPTELICKVVCGGELKDNKGLCFQGQYFPLEFVGEKDRYDLEKTIALGVDYISASFVNSKKDLEEIKQFCLAQDPTLKFIAKIESQKAMENLDEILENSDGIMVARGDLGVEMNFDMLPILQRKLIERARQEKKLCIVATEMLESMIRENRPTRAEISDVAGAVFQGANAVMLSGETAVGVNPVLCVQAMSKIILSAEKNLNYKSLFEKHSQNPTNCNDLILQTGVGAGFNLKCKAIVSYTSKGANAMRLSTMSSIVPIVAITNSHRTFNQLALCSNCIAVYSKEPDDIFRCASHTVKNLKIAQTGDLIIVTTGNTDKIANVLKFEIID
ncbi:MAG: pyruvate kinase [Clostridia bacterium]|nr:pyruvate kinase [Clostridia bacterium]